MVSSLILPFILQKQVALGHIGVDYYCDDAMASQ
jgi:hypothetical protein